MSPILVRPVREQLEHDRMIRQLQAKFRRKYDAVIKPGAEQQAPVKSGTAVVYPDILLFSQERGRRLQAVAQELCDGSWTPLLTNLVQTKKLSAKDRQMLRQLIDDLDPDKAKKTPRERK